MHTDCSHAVSQSECSPSTLQCICLHNYLASSSLTHCNPRALDDPCTADDHCAFGVINSICVNAVCKCKSGYKENDVLNGTCLKVEIGDHCDWHSNCGESVTNIICIDNICKCLPGYVQNANATSCNLHLLDDHCDVDTDCSYTVAGSYCEMDPVTAEMSCQCSSAFHRVNGARDTCTERKINDRCDTDADCSSVMANSLCEDQKKVCVCKSGLVANNEGTLNLSRKIHNKCSTDNDCSDHV